MSHQKIYRPDPKLDLVLERVIDVPRELVWAAWTKPEHVTKWFTPAPWETAECEIDLRPGGVFRFVMRSPEGKTYPHVCCFLEVVANEKLVWTDVLGPGFRPSPVDRGGAENPALTAVLLLEPRGKGTKYTAIAMHGDEATRKRHEEMGFHDGWGKCLDQLVAHVKQM